MSSELDLLGKKNVRKILAALDEASMSAQEVSEESSIPLTSTYRYLEKLSDAGLVDQREELRSDGNHHNIYTSQFRSCLFYVDDGTIEYDICTDDIEEVDNLLWLWQQVRD